MLPGLTRSLSARCVRAAPKLIRTASLRRIGHQGRPRCSLEQLARKGDFAAISSLLQGACMKDQALYDWLNEKPTIKDEETALHRLLKHQPPVELVRQLREKLIQLHQGDHGSIKMKILDESNESNDENLPSQCQEETFIIEEWLDSRGRNPLHIASASACHIHVIDLLLDGETCTMPAVWKDDFGRYPLHWICANPHGQTFSLKNEKSPNKKLSRAARTSAYQKAVTNVRRIIARLITIFPEALAIADKSGCMPLDLARSNKADTSIILLLDRSLSALRKLKSEHSENGNVWMDLSETTLEISNSTDDCDSDDVSSLGTFEQAERVSPDTKHSLFLI